ncbi:MAG TPA: TadE family protein [Lacipirellulaceae bacterium]
MANFSTTHSSRNVAESLPCVCEPLSKRCHRSPWLSRARRRSRRGAAVTEFAVVAPVFFLMVVGFLEFGRALMVQQVLINASRVGARQAITTSATTGEVETVVQDYTAGVAVPGVSVVVSPDPAAADPGDAITVTTSVAFSEVSWMASPWFLGDTTLTASSQMRKEGFE